MTYYQITSSQGVDMGVYEGGTPEEAIRAMNADAGEEDLDRNDGLRVAAVDLTDRQIEQLREEAIAAGDDAQCHVCHVALGDRAPGEGGMVWPTSRDEARVECARVIAAARAMED